MSKTTLNLIPVSEGQSLELKIDSMSYDNSAVARFRDFIIFVDRGAPCDFVQAQITSLKPDYARAKIIKIKSSDQNYRKEAECKLFKVCGGCQWQHLPYEKQLEQKDLLMKNFTAKLDLKEGVLKNIIEADDKWHYRNKVQYPVRTIDITNRLKAGYFEWHSNELINIKFCPIQNKAFDGIVETVRELAPKYNIIAYDGKKKKGWLRHICIRAGINTNEVLLTLVAINDRFPHSQDFTCEVLKKHPELVGVCINTNTATTNVIYGPKTKALQGRGYIFEKIKDIKYKISATSFFQINIPQTIKLLNIIENMVCRANAPREHLYNCVLDAYCGTGLIALSLAKYTRQIVGIEEIKQAIEDAVFTARENNIKNAVFINGKVENKIENILKKNHIDIVILDPPRAGCNKVILKKILNSDVKKIIYVSCNPSTLIRDLEILCTDRFKTRLYEIKSIQPIDMFPHTYHIENIVLLEK